MRIIARVVMLLVVFTPMIGSAQRIPVSEQYDRDAVARVRALSAAFRVPDDDPADKARYYAGLQEATDRLRGEVDGYVQAAVNPREGSEGVQARLRTLLALHRLSPEYGDLPFARQADLRAGHSLLVAYTIVRPPHHDSATIRGYLSALDRFELVATTGDDDFDGFSLFTKELASPVTDELWLLAWGRAHTFNGTKIRFRVYAFDGQSFRTVWAPEDMLHATVHFTASGFEIDHELRQPPYNMHDEYLLTPDGPIKIF